MNNKKLWFILLVAFFLAGVSGSYFLYQKFLNPGKNGGESVQSVTPEAQDLMLLRMSYPVDNRLVPVEKNVPRRVRQIAVAEEVVEEYFRGAGNGRPSPVPAGVKLLGLYKDARQILYLDLSDEVRRNFPGDALSEYLLLKGLYESVIANVPDVSDIKVLVEGKELETLGGHFFLKYPLKEVVGPEVREEKAVTGE